MTAKEIALTLVNGWTQLAATQTVKAGVSDGEVITEYYYTVDSDAPEDKVQGVIDSYEGYVAQELAAQ